MLAIAAVACYYYFSFLHRVSTLDYMLSDYYETENTIKKNQTL